MIFPKLPPRQTMTDYVDVFLGYNHNPRTADGEWYDMVNMTSDSYPLLSPRKSREKKRFFDEQSHNVKGMINKNGLCWVEAKNKNLYFHMKGYSYDLGLTTVDDDAERTLISMGAYVIIRPDNMYFNTENSNDKGKIEASFATGAVSFEMTDIGGIGYSGVEKGDKAPDSETKPDYWLDTSTTPHSLKQWDETSGLWVGIATTYIRINAPNIARDFKEGDGVLLKGLEKIPDLDNKISIIQKAHHEEGGAEDFIIVIGIIDETFEQSEGITVSRNMPLMDYVVESNNRLWGCKYGPNANGDIVNEIYASKLGDFKNWNVFAGVSTDSYAVSLGSDGVFTGAVSYLGNPIFFKENYIHQIYGYYPAQYQVQTTQGRGVQQYSNKSLAVVNETLYYKSGNSICAYRGSLPTEISSAFGDVFYKDAIGVSHGNKYYVSMCDLYGARHLFVYDTLKAMWHKEDDIEVKEFCSCGDLYIRTESPDYLVVSGKGDEHVAWAVESGKIGLSYHNKKRLARMNLRMSMEVGARVRVFVEYDSSGNWQQLFAMNGTKLDSFAVPITPRRCDHFRIRIEGVGQAKIYSIQRNYELGSDVK